MMVSVKSRARARRWVTGVEQHRFQANSGKISAIMARFFQFAFGLVLILRWSREEEFSAE